MWSNESRTRGTGEIAGERGLSSRHASLPVAGSSSPSTRALACWQRPALRPPRSAHSLSVSVCVSAPPTPRAPYLEKRHTHTHFLSLSLSLSLSPFLQGCYLSAPTIAVHCGLSLWRLSSMGCSSFLSSSTSLRILCGPRSLLRHRRGAHRSLTPGNLQFAQQSGRTVSVGFGESPVPASSEAAGAVSLEEDAGKSASELPSAALSQIGFADSVASAVDTEAQRRILEKQLRRKSERTTYLFAAVASTVGITFLTAGAVYYRFAWQTQGSEVPLTDLFATFSLAVGASVGMEYWARWAHRALWHDSLWSMHESHHRPRDGPFETNDVFAIINAVPAIALMAYGFFHTGLVPGLCFGAGLGITVFGIAYMFVHDGLVHRRFPVGPLADVPYFQRVAAAHQLHHADKFKGVPYGLFLGPQELEAQVGGAEELQKTIQMRKRSGMANH